MRDLGPPARMRWIYAVVSKLGDFNDCVLTSGQLYLA